MLYVHVRWEVDRWRAGLKGWRVRAQAQGWRSDEAFANDGRGLVEENRSRIGETPNQFKSSRCAVGCTRDLSHSFSLT